MRLLVRLVLVMLLLAAPGASFARTILAAIPGESAACPAACARLFSSESEMPRTYSMIRQSRPSSQMQS